MDKYGEIKLKLINDSKYFWTIYDEMCNDKSYFINKRDELLEAYKSNQLYGLEVKESDNMCERDDRYDKIFAKQYNQNLSDYLLPCFCIKTENIAIMLWVHTKARRIGLGRKLLELLNIHYVLRPISETKDFWNKCNIQSLKFL